jgi:hypothetical protein
LAALQEKWINHVQYRTELYVSWPCVSFPPWGSPWLHRSVHSKGQLHNFCSFLNRFPFETKKNRRHYFTKLSIFFWIIFMLNISPFSKTIFLYINASFPEWSLWTSFAFYFKRVLDILLVWCKYKNFLNPLYSFG